jgi:hypothetical protein
MREPRIVRGAGDGAAGGQEEQLAQAAGLAASGGRVLVLARAAGPLEGDSLPQGLQAAAFVLLAVPLTWRRIVLVGAMLAGFVLLFPVPAVRRFYELQLPHSGLATMLAVAALGAATLTGFWILSRRRGRGPPPAVRP